MPCLAMKRQARRRGLVDVGEWGAMQVHGFDEHLLFMENDFINHHFMAFIIF